MALEFHEADGYLPVTIHRADGSEPLVVALDVYEANNVYFHICDQHEEAHERGQAFCEWLAKKGLLVNHAVGFLIIEGVHKAVEEFKKKFELAPSSPTPGSPDSSDSPPPA
jgi:hypothetical protein